MKRVALMLGMILMVQAGYAQSEPEEVEREIGMNMAFFVKNLLRNESAFSASFQNYLLSYKGIRHQKQVAVRLGVGFYTFKQKEAGQDETSKTQSISVRWGYEHQKSLNKRWGINIGGDIIAGYRLQSNPFFGGRYRATRIGIGPVLGVQFKITPRVKIQTESFLSWHYTVEKNVPPDIFQTGLSDRKTTEMVLSLPHELFLTFSF